MNPQDLKSCAEEPITIPGSIQNHGLLFVLEKESLRIEQVSANCQDLTGFSSENLLGTSLTDYLVEDHCARFVSLLASAADGCVNPFTIDIVRQDGTLLSCDAIAHVSPEDLNIVEFEVRRHGDEGSESLDNYFQLVQSSLKTTTKLSSVEEIAELITVSIKQFTGFDRVMVYRFHEDFSGEVIGEAREREMEPYLHLRYPATDIPEQARALYLKNWVRLIHDVDAEVAPIIPTIHPRLRRPTPLDKSVLRSVSPIHLEYLRNMGVQSSMSVSLIVDDKLWGLVACHHRSKRFVSYGLRATCSLFGLVLSSQLARAEKAALQHKKLERQKNLLELIRNLDPVASLEESFSRSLTSLTSIFDSSGAAFIDPDTILTHGETPSESDLRELAATLSKRAASQPFLTEAIAEDLPQFSHFLPTTAGLLAIPLGVETWLMITRKEIVQTVRWAGNPNLEKEVSASGTLHPRKSFSGWVETVKGRSVKWPRDTQDLVDEIRVGLSGFLISRNIVLEKNNDDLRQFASIIAHEVRSQIQPPLMALSIFQGKASEPDLKALADNGAASLETLSELVTEMLQFAQHEGSESELQEVDLVSLTRSLVDQALQSQSSLKVDVKVGELPTLMLSLPLVTHLLANLIGNSVIHGPDQKQEDFTLQIGSRTEGDKIVFFVRDNGRGIAEEEQLRIFEYFYRGQNSLGRKGTGIGLAFVRRILERSGDKIWVESAEGEGTTFFFTLSGG